MDAVAYALASTRVPDKAASPRTTSTGSLSATTGMWYTVINVTGAGWLYNVGAYASLLGSAKSTRFRITIDGGTAQVVGDTLNTGLLIGAMKTNGDYRMQMPFTPACRFRSSLKVEVAQFSGTTEFLMCEATYGM